MYVVPAINFQEVYMPQISNKYLQWATIRKGIVKLSKANKHTAMNYSYITNSM